MKHTLMHTIVRTLGLVVVMALAPISVRAACTYPYLLWSKTIDGAFACSVNAVATDAIGNIFVTGYFRGLTDFGGVTLNSPNSNNDIFVAKYSAAGALQWAVRAGNTGTDTGTGIATDPAGNVYVTGTFQGSVNFGLPILTAVGTVDVFLAKFDTGGNYVWVNRYGPTNGTSFAVPYGMSVNANNVAITGEYEGSSNWGGATFTSAGLEDIFVARYGNDGTPSASRTFGGALSDRGYGVAWDAAGNIVFTGRFAGTVNFGGANLVGSTPSCVYLVKYSSANAHVWSAAFNSSGGSDGFAIAVDASSNVILTGGFGSSINFGGGALNTIAGYEAYLAKFNSAGAHLWSKSFPGTGGESGQSLALDASGNIILGGGKSTGSIDLGGGPLASGSGTFYAKFDAAGTHQWSSVLQLNSAEPNVAADPSGNVIIGGYAAADIFIQKFGPDTVQPCIGSIVDVGNDEGHHVKISFFKSGYDRAGAPAPIVRYDAYRRDDPPPSFFATTDASSASELAAIGWEFVGSVPPHGESEYLIGAPTLADSTLENGVFHSAFFIRAATGNPSLFYDSEIDSGYSVDNLTPTAPANFAFNAGVLTWDPSDAQDLHHYSVYGSASDAFATASLVKQTTEPTVDVSATPYAFYFVTATDVSGNESKPSRIGAHASGGDHARVYALGVSCYPNPFNPRTTVSYTVPSRGHVSVAIYDLHGALVATLFDGERSAGAYSVNWDGRTGDAAVAASGVYFARIEHSSGTRTKKMVLLK